MKFLCVDGPIRGLMYIVDDNFNKGISNKVKCKTGPVGTRKGDFLWGLLIQQKEGICIFLGVRRLSKKWLRSYLF